MWQIYGMMALDLIRERHRTADRDRRARGASRHPRDEEIATRAQRSSLLIDTVRHGHRA
jgi:hypothetical protein